jgi:alpha-galactosidase
VRVFILAGQSNMEGKAKLPLLEYQATQPETAERFAHLRDGDKWAVRDDVWIDFLDRAGPLTVGFGSKNCIGPELDFGHVVGDHYDEPVFIIKTAWGGRSLYRDFRPPSAGLPDDTTLGKFLANAQKNRPDATRDEIEEMFGADYRLMMREVRSALRDIDRAFPDARRRGYEFAGFVWFQGWNDMVNEEATAEYAENLAHFIRDVRGDLEAPDMPFVIGQMGVDGQRVRDNKRVKFKRAQAEAARLPEFQGTVALVKTDVFWDQDAQRVFDRGWKENIEEWEKVGSDYPYHYLGSAKTYSDIGRAFGEAMIKLRGKRDR